MIHVKIEDLYTKKHALLWSILSFKAGMINAAGFLIAGSYVSHVTGFGTQVGLQLGHDHLTFGLELLVIPVAFIGGATLVSLILDSNYSKDKIPQYPIVQFLITFLLGLISLLFSIGFLQTNQKDFFNENTIFLIGLLCLICGLKNGLTTWATHGKIRTTHLTGLSTDIGLHLPKMFKGANHQSRYPEPKKVNYVRILTLISFSIGSFLSAVLIPAIGHKIFHVTFFISFILLNISFFSRKKISALVNKPIQGVFHENDDETITEPTYASPGH
jgi:uncharacterized membrane protein YoaK (UPF0700 family)